jgi:hypothetical protein
MAAIERIIAAASRILGGKNGKNGKGVTGNSGNASAAWDMYRTVPEVGAYADWVSNVMSGSSLFAGMRGPDGVIRPVPSGHRAAELVSSIAGGPGGQSVLLGEVGTQLCVPGEFWQIIVPGDTDRLADDRWYVLSTREVSVGRGKITADVGSERIEIPEFDPAVPADASIPAYFRVWNPAPDLHMEATSPVIRSLVVLEELRLLNAAVAAIARSRITGRGILLIPAGTRFPTQPGQDQAEDSLIDTFIEVASTAIREPQSAAATVPIVLEVPEGSIDGVRWLQFTSEFDAMAIQLREEAIRRFATGADVPAEILTGLGDASHWGAWAITAEALRTGAEPRLKKYCAALTSEWLHPVLASEAADGDESWRDVLVWYDTSELRSSSNKGASALEAFRLGLVNGAAARRELGFTEADAPGAPDDTASARPGKAQPVPDPTTTERTALPVSETEAPPSEMGVQERAVVAAGAVLDSFTAGTDAALAEAVDGLVWTALAIANRKMLLTPIVPRPFRTDGRALVSSAELHVKYPARGDADVQAYGLLADAWSRVPSVAARYGLDTTVLTRALDDYASALLVTGQPHVFDNVPRLLGQIRVRQQVAA